MAISKQQPMRPALEDVIDAVNDIGDIEPYITDAVNDWLDEHPEATTTVQDDSLTTAKYQDGSVTGSKIATNAITAEKIATGAVTAAKIATGSVTAEKIANGAVGRDKLTGDAISGNNEPGFTAGSASALLGDIETASWMERTTAADGAALVDAIYGNTLVWNQLVSAPYTTAAGEVGGVSFAVSSDYVVTASGTTTGTGNFFFSQTIPLTAGHNYLLSGIDTFYDSNSSMRLRLYDGSSVVYSQLGAGSHIFTVANSGTASLFVNISESGNDIDVKVRPQLFDLTTMFGAGNEPTSVAEFEALFPASYYPYDAGSLLPVRVEGVETVATDDSWSSQLAIPASTYFPGGMRSAGSVRDELRSDAAVTRVGSVDLGTVTWEMAPTSLSGVNYFVTTDIRNLSGGIARPVNNSTVMPTKCAKYDAITANQAYLTNATGISVETSGRVTVYDPTYASSDAATFKAAMSGVMLNYELATPTTTTIDPPLPMSYRVGEGGTERVMVATGTQSSPPVFATRYPLDTTDLAESIAPRESATATTNHQVGDLIMLGWTLCKATQVIVTGENIEIGTNVTKTSVAAEIAALS